MKTNDIPQLAANERMCRHSENKVSDFRFKLVKKKSVKFLIYDDSIGSVPIRVFDMHTIGQTGFPYLGVICIVLAF